MGDLAFLDALVHYRTMFPTLASLGTGTPPAHWKAELDRVTPDALDASLTTGASTEGGSATGVRNFEARQKLRALHSVRGEVDSSYIDPYLKPFNQEMAGRRIGFTVRLGF